MKLPTSIKAVIFDVDGLLIDSEPYWKKTTETFFAKHNKPFKQEVHQYLHGRGLRDTIEYFKREHGFVGDTDELIAKRREMLYEYLLPNVTLMEGAEKLIRSLHKEGLPLAIATSGHTRDRTKLLLQKLGLEDIFSVLVSGDDVTNAKPAPDIFLLAAQLLGVDPRQCLVLEDAPNGVLAGKAAGMVVYGVNKNEEIYFRLKEVKPDKLLHSLLELV